MSQSTFDVRFSGPRDHELRMAHQVAFTRIHEARAATDYRAEVSKAVQELIDACEAYTLTR
jgi:hypothetical protein